MKNKILIGLVIIIFLSLIFYWFELRPVNIKKECAKWSLDKAIKKYNYNGEYQSEDYNVYYSRCLREKGL